MLVSVSQWFVAPFQTLSTLMAPCSSLRFCNITAEPFRVPRRTAPWPSRGTEGSGWETLYLGNIHKNALCWQQSTGIFR